MPGRRDAETSPALQRLGLGALLAFVLAVAVVVAIDREGVLAALATAPPGAIAGAFALSFAGFLLRGARWTVLVRRHGTPVPTWRSIVQGLATGKTGQVVKAWDLARVGVPLRASIPMGIAERLADGVALVALLLVALPFAHAAYGPLAAAAAVLLLVAAVVGARSRLAGRLAHRALRAFPRLAHTAEHVAEAHTRLRALLRAPPLALPTAVSLAAFVLEAVALALLTSGVGHPLGVGRAAFLLAATSVAAMLTLIPGGLVVVEGGLLVGLSYYGVPLADAAAIALAFRGITLWLSLGLDVVAIAVLRKAQRGVPASPA